MAPVGGFGRFCRVKLIQANGKSRPFTRTDANEDTGTNTDEDGNVQKPCTIGGYLRPCGERSEDQSCDQVAQGVGTLRRHRPER
jgi:hypothetical protein